MSNSKDFWAFTHHTPGVRLRKIITPGGVSLPRSDPSATKPIHKVRALWDTGATNTNISASVVTTLGLRPIDRIQNRGINTTTECNLYLVDIHLPNNVVVPDIRVVGVQSIQDADILIGMDIIGIGDLAITNADGSTTVTFRWPSIETIDYVKEVERVVKEREHGKTYQRNDPVTIKNESTGEERLVPYKVFDRKYRDHGWEIIEGKLHP